MKGLIGAIAPGCWTLFLSCLLVPTRSFRFTPLPASGKGGQWSVGSTPYGQDGWYSPQMDKSMSIFDATSSASIPSNVSSPSPGGLKSVSHPARPPINEGSHVVHHPGWSKQRLAVETWREYDEVWESMREEAKLGAQKEPLLVSFIYSTILNQKSLEAAVSFHMANKLATPNMVSTQVMAIFDECFDSQPGFRRSLRRDFVAVRERDPACVGYHDALLYFKGFQALQTHRVSHWLYTTGRKTLAHYFQSQVNQEFQIDIHPAAKLGEGIFIDHGTGIVVGETCVVGNDVSMLHQVTLGGSGMEKGERHPKIGDGVLIGASACLLGNIRIGNGAQIGAGSLVTEDVPDRCVAVGVPAKILGKSRTKEPATQMEQDCFKDSWAGQNI